MTTTATTTERKLMDTNRFRLETIADRQRSSRTTVYLFTAGIVTAAAAVTAALLVG